MLIVLIVIIGLSVLILGHEAGHFLAAKLYKVRVDEFGFGFPPRLFGFLRYRGKKTKSIELSGEVDVAIEAAELGKREIITETITEKVREAEEIVPVKTWKIIKGNKEPEREINGLSADDTVYSVNWLPFGGFVRIAGENDRMGEDFEKLESLPIEKKMRLFSAKPAWKRSVIIVAGVAVNFLLGWLLVSFVFMMGTPPALLIADVQEESPAAAAGILRGDIVKHFTDADAFTAFINEHRGEPITVTVRRSGEEKTFTVVPRAKTVLGEGALGVFLAEGGVPRHGVLSALSEGLKSSLQISLLTVTAFYELVKNLFTKASLLDGVVGPVGIFSVAQQTGEIGIPYLIQLLGLISLNLAVINLIPFPALDGGRILMILAEKVKGSPVSRRVEALTNGIGFAFLLLLIALITIRDISRLF